MADSLSTRSDFACKVVVDAREALRQNAKIVLDLGCERGRGSHGEVSGCAERGGARTGAGRTLLLLVGRDRLVQVLALLAQLLRAPSLVSSWVDVGSQCWTLARSAEHPNARGTLGEWCSWGRWLGMGRAGHLDARDQVVVVVLERGASLCHRANRVARFLAALEQRRACARAFFFNGRALE